MEQAELEFVSHRVLAPGSDGGIVVSLWLGRDPRIAMADTAREVA
jgi:hypothetical protein